ncbi:MULTISPECIES: helix-turn-helix domain-containing protein [Brevibacillus]|uniref:DNA-binding protein n=1 Tax=Brevibacillus borstelensis AK1 TaxID=1300222 RepID=M8DT65_9BACL|nr:helix-turn-helix transcriptional regulator [Brevibacillus borstelensis]EMT50111.1 DNA-binding protein [Brevibacillus borstelensis AK1]KKX52515.1 DNA-binding protein [Brevibacillus borstelensis cifa_chp40]MBE5393734.1 helix-turn-helix transcriptional regulator [Brevibacillus borstelensis]MCC0566781.1 helix-turn-helix transcriptional regulator [Brevibacillus borstelensis]MCM3473296.1 helix-turn-helix transcriptional regulator [Brevibacillus borstelensis]
MERINLNFIARRRMEIGITLKEMAAALGFKNASTYLKYEKGEYDFKANHLPVLTRMLKCQLRDLFICLTLLL